MIQDIFPYRLDNTFHHAAPVSSDFFSLSREKRCSCKSGKMEAVRFLPFGTCSVL